jgi:hypothetical protein
MHRNDLAAVEQLRQEWTDQFVQVTTTHADLQRFAGRVGRVVTVNWNGHALVDFADGAWYDIPATAQHLTRVDDTALKAKYDGTANSAQAKPERQG